MFKVGDKVRIIAPFEDVEVCGVRFCWADRQMSPQVGRIGEVIDGYKTAEGGIHVRIYGDDHDNYWIPPSLEHVNTLHAGDVVSIDGVFLYRLDKAAPNHGGENDHLPFTYSTIRNGKWKPMGDGAVGLFKGAYNVIQKYRLRNAKGHFIKCDRYVGVKYIAPLEAAVKRRKPVAKDMAPAIIEKPAVAPIKPIPEPIKPVLDIRAELAKKARAVYAGNRCNYSIEFDNGKIRHQAPDACHARLAWNTYLDEGNGAKEIVNIALNITPHYNKLTKENKEIYPKFVNYMLNDSPWAFCFVTKDVKEALEVGILMDVNQNVSHIVGAAMSLRLATEFPSTLKPFGDALDKGYSGNVAHLISGHLMDGRVTSWPNHSALTSSLNKGAIIKFFKNGYPVKLPAIAKDRKQTRYQIFDTISPGSGYAGMNVGDGESLYEFVTKQAVSTKRGEGFEAKTVFDYEATLIKMADAFTKELV